jgi:polar amino acid transport system ATP-binding protein
MTLPPPLPPGSAQPVLEIEGLVKRFNGQTVLDGIDLTVAAGETVCVLGPSGSGKSTMLRCINWLETPDAGRVRLLGQHVGVRPNGHRMSDRELASIRSQIGMVFQNFALWPHLTVLENIVEAPVHVQGRPAAEVRDEADTLLELVGLVDKRDVYPARLSGGQKQRVGIARALAGRPPLILFDEPTSALDPERVHDILQIMQNLARRGMTMLIVTHEMNFARRSADRIVFMDEGKVVETAEPEAFFTAPRSARARSFLANHHRQVSPHHDQPETVLTP